MTTAFHTDIFTVKLNASYKAVSIHKTQRNDEKQLWKSKKERPQNNFKSFFTLLPIQIPVLVFEGLLVISALLMFAPLKATFYPSALKLHESGLDLNSWIFTVVWPCLRDFSVFH